MSILPPRADRPCALDNALNEQTNKAQLAALAPAFQPLAGVVLPHNAVHTSHDGDKDDRNAIAI